MAGPKLSLASAQVQVVGHWNPSIFVPGWFADAGLLPRAEADEAKIAIIHEEVAQFNLPWVALQVTRDRLVATTTQDSYAESLRDLVLGTLELLSHTPTQLLGINHDFILEYASRETFDAVGWKLAPPDHWPMLDRPGLATMQMQGQRTDDWQGYVRVKVEPILDGSFRAVVGYNDHYDLSPSAESSSTAIAAEILGQRWASSASEARKTAEHLSGLTP